MSIKKLRLCNHLTNSRFKDGVQSPIDTSKLIEQETHERIVCFRPPGGRLNPSLVKMAEEPGLKTVPWNVDPRNWSSDTTPGKIVDEVWANSQPGCIVVMHEGKRQTLEALPMLIRALKQQGWRLVTISELSVDGRSAQSVSRPQPETQEKKA